MNPLLLHVESAPDQHGDELPQSFRFGRTQVRVIEVLDRWHHGKGDPEWPAANYYKVRGDDQHQYLLKYELESSNWYLVRQW